MQVSTAIITEMLAPADQAAAGVGAGFAALIDPKSGDDSAAFAQAANQVTGAAPNAEATEPKIGASKSAPTIEMPVEVTGEKEAPKGSSEELDNHRVWKTAEELVDLSNVRENGQKVEVAASQSVPGTDGATAALLEGDVEPALVRARMPDAGFDAVSDVVEAPADQKGSNGTGTASPKSAEDGPTTATAEVKAHPTAHANPIVSEDVIAVPMLVAPASEVSADVHDDVTMPQMKLADPAWAHESEASDNKDRTEVSVPLDTASASEVSMTAMAQHMREEAAKVVAERPLVTPAVDGASSHGKLVVKTLHQLEVVDGMAEGASKETSAAVDRPAINSEFEEVQVKIERHTEGVRERAPSPSNLGRPVLAMQTHELLQESVAPRSDTPPPHLVSGAHSTAPGAPVVAPVIVPGHGAPAASHQLHHVVLTTSAKMMAEDVGVELAHSAKKGSHEISIRLDPAELGRIEVKLTIADDGRVKATLSADNPRTHDLLRRDADTLIKSLNDAGLKADAGDFQFDGRQPGQSEQRQSERQGSRVATGLSDELAHEDKTEVGPKRSTRGRLV